MHKSALMAEYDAYEDFLSLHGRARNDRMDAPAVEEEAVVEALLAFVRRERDRPFFATYFMFWNHAPYRLPFEDISHLPPLERYQRGNAYLDRVLRDLIARLRQERLLDNTIVVVSADHGEGFGLHHANFDHVGHIWEDDVRVPFVVHVPGLGRHVTARQGSNVDFAPTVAGLLGLSGLPSWQGQNLLSASYTPRPTLLLGRASYATNGLVDGHLKYIEYTDGSMRGLFDLSVDPHEQHNLADAHPGITADYRKLVHAWLPVAEARVWALNEH
jgi:membrane-anchored protein YejM (alkaline phosphatase superfamily)